VTNVPITASPTRLQALQAGAVFGSMLATPDDVRAERLGMKRLAFVGDYTRAMIGGMVTADATIQNNPDLVVRFVRGLLKSIAFVKNSREAGTAALAKHLDLPPDVANEVWDIAIRAYNDDGSETDEELRNNLQLQAPDASTVQVFDVFDLRFAREAYDSLQRSGWKP
jgi:NitT/TauT family transport system substrate-binding protein